MTTASVAEASPRREPHFDIVEAEFETLDRPNEKPTAVSGLTATPSKSESLTAHGMDMLRKQQQATPPPFGSVRGGPVFWTAGLCLVAAAFWFSGGHALVPQDAVMSAQASARPLRIESVVSRVDTSGGRTTLNIDGVAANDGGGALQMPPLNIQVVANDGVTTRYNLGISGNPVAPGEKFVFASRLPVPKNGIKSVSVAFGR